MRSRADLRDNQELITSIIRGSKAKLIVSGMGSGKTCSALTAIREEMDRFKIQHVLVIAPRFVALNTWPDEIATWVHTNPMSYAIAVGDEPERIKAIEAKADLTFINFDNLQWLSRHICSVSNWYWDTVVLDESSRMKAGEVRTKQTKVKNAEGVVRVRKGGNLTRFGTLAIARKKIERIYELTGTPTPQGLQDLWGQIYLLDQGERLGRSKSEFESRWFDKNEYTYSLTPKPGAEAEILARIADIMVTIPQQKLTEDAIFVPMKVDLPPKVMQDYRDFERTLYSAPYDVEAVTSGVLANKLLQYSNGHLYKEDRSVVHVHDAKFEALEELVQQSAGENLIVFYNFKFDKDAIKKRYPYAVIANEDKDFLTKWNAGKIKMLLAHPACLHPSTEVLTEKRGWKKIVEVRRNDRVFDGEQFVNHSGCQYSGVKEIIEIFGIKMTLDHQMLVNGKWMMAENVRDNQDIREKARYTYTGASSGLREMFEVRGCVRNAEAKRNLPQQDETQTLSPLRFGQLSQPDRHPDLADLARYESSNSRPEGHELLRPWDWFVLALGNLCKFLRGHEGKLPGRFDYRAGGREQRLREGQLHLGNAAGTAGKQAEQSPSSLQWGNSAPCGTVQKNWADENKAQVQTGCRYVSRGSSAEGVEFDLWDREEGNQEHCHGSAAESSPVYDLVDCGPNHRFVVRNADGEAFVSHNSIGHGTNLQFGGHLAAWFGPTFSLELWLQANMRLPRPGQKHQVYIYPIIARGTYDERAMDILQDKDATQERIIQNFLYHPTYSQRLLV